MLRRLAYTLVSRPRFARIEAHPGWLGLLPPELIDAIALAPGVPGQVGAGLPQLHVHVSRDLRIHRRQAVLKARCLMTFDYVISDAYLRQGPYAHTEYAKLCIRSRMEQDLLKMCMKECVVLHYVTPRPSLPRPARGSQLEMPQDPAQEEVSTRLARGSARMGEQRRRSTSAWWRPAVPASLNARRRAHV